MLHKRGFLGAYLLITFAFTCQHDQLVGACSSRLQKDGFSMGQARNKGVLVTGGGGSLLRHIPVLDI